MNQPKVSTFEDLLCELEKSPEYRRAYRRQKPLYDLVFEIITRRNELGLTQKELADRAGTHQSAISRIESGEHNPRLNTLVEIAEGLESRLEIRLVPILEFEDKDCWQTILRAEASPQAGGSRDYQEAPVGSEHVVKV